MTIRLRTVSSPKLRYLSPEQLAEIAANLVVEFDCGVQPVSFSEMPPADTSIPWAPTEGCGQPIGKLKTFKNGEWV